MENNFFCKTCGEEFYVPSYSQNLGLNPGYFIKGKRMICPECHSTDIDHIDSGEFDPSSIFFGRFSSMNDEDKKKVLKKRAQISAKKNSERVNHLNKNFTGKGKSTDY